MQDFETDKHYEEMEPNEGIEFLSKLFSVFISPETGKFTEEISCETEIKNEEDLYPSADEEELYEKALKINFPDDKYVINPWGKETLSEESLRVKKEYTELLLSKENGNPKILTGTVAGKTTISMQGKRIVFAVVKVSPENLFSIYIPENEFLLPGEYKNSSNQITLRIGSEVDFIVRQIFPEDKIALGSRTDAMKIKRRFYFIEPVNRFGDTRIGSGKDVQARVQLVAKAGAVVEIFGTETFIPLRLLLHEFILDAKKKFMPGDLIDVEITEKHISGDTVNIECSRLPLVSKVIEAYISRMEKGDSFKGTVVNITPNKNQVYVNTDVGFDVLCGFPPEKENEDPPMIGDEVMIEITEAKEGICKAFGRIESYRKRVKN